MKPSISYGRRNRSLSNDKSYQPDIAIPAKENIVSKDYRSEKLQIKEHKPSLVVRKTTSRKSICSTVLDESVLKSNLKKEDDEIFETTLDKPTFLTRKDDDKPSFEESSNSTQSMPEAEVTKQRKEAKSEYTSSGFYGRQRTSGSTVDMGHMSNDLFSSYHDNASTVDSGTPMSIPMELNFLSSSSSSSKMRIDKPRKSQRKSKERLKKKSLSYFNEYDSSINGRYSNSVIEIKKKPKEVEEENDVIDQYIIDEIESFNQFDPLPIEDDIQTDNYYEGFQLKRDLSAFDDESAVLPDKMIEENTSLHINKDYSFFSSFEQAKQLESTVNYKFGSPIIHENKWNCIAFSKMRIENEGNCYYFMLCYIRDVMFYAVYKSTAPFKNPLVITVHGYKAISYCPPVYYVNEFERYDNITIKSKALLIIFNQHEDMIFKVIESKIKGIESMIDVMCDFDEWIEMEGYVGDECFGEFDLIDGERVFKFLNTKDDYLIILSRNVCNKHKDLFNSSIKVKTRFVRIVELGMNTYKLCRFYSIVN